MSKFLSSFFNLTDFSFLCNLLPYLSELRERVPSDRLKDCCAGARALLFELAEFLRKHSEYHDNF